MIASQPEKQWASESTRWYTQDGLSVEDVVAKNGSGRKATLRDARKPDNQWIPSVTTVLRLLAKPELDRWKSQQYLGEAMLQAMNDRTSLLLDNSKDWVDRVMVAAEEGMNKAREKGSEVHGEVDRFLLNPNEMEYASSPFCGAATRALIDIGMDQWPMEVEKTLAVRCGEIWVAGKTDLVFPEQKIIVDWKTTSKACDGSERLGWDDHLIQLSAYNMALFGGTGRCFNVFLSTSDPGKYEVVPWLEEETEWGAEMYSLMFRLWCLKNRYFPKTT